MRDHEFEVDRATAVAWREFQARLADQLVAMDEDDVALIAARVGEEPEAGAAPYVQFCAFGEGMLRAEVAGNHVLDERWQLDDQAMSALAELGWAAPTYAPDDEPDHGSLNHFVDVERTEGDRLAVMATRALRDVFGVPHPALLTGDVGDEEPAPASEAAAHERGDEPVATFPYGGRDELVALVDRALTPYFGSEPRHDSDGDIPVDAGRSIFFVRVPEEVPVIEIFGCIAADVADHVAAEREIAILNRDARFAKFRLAGDSIVVELQLPAWPFVPEHLRAMVAMLTEMIATHEGDLVARVGGRHLADLLDPAGHLCEHGDDADEDGDEDAVGEDEAPGGVARVEEELTDDERELFGIAAPDDDATRGVARGSRRQEMRDRFTYAELVMAQLNAEKRGSVGPELAASLCGHDADVILDLLRANEEEEIAWRQARDEEVREGDVEGVAACESELRYAAAQSRLLRRALRLVVEGEAAVDAERRPEQSVRQRPRRRPLPPRPPRPRKVPDPTIEEVDPDIWG